jgi:hypothetical protein
VDAGVKLAPLHEAALHTWLLPTLRQAPAPSHIPSVPHSLVAVTSSHWLCGSWPSSTGAHVPSLLPVSAAEQALQPMQAPSQQTPSMQLPSAHSLLAEHLLPTGKLVPPLVPAELVVPAVPVPVAPAVVVPAVPVSLPSPACEAPAWSAVEPPRPA